MSSKCQDCTEVLKEKLPINKEQQHLERKVFAYLVRVVGPVGIRASKTFKSHPRNYLPISNSSIIHNLSAS